MSSPNTRLMTEDEKIAYDSGLMDGADKKKKQIVNLLEELFSKAENAESRRFLVLAIGLVQKSNMSTVDGQEDYPDIEDYWMAKGEEKAEQRIIKLLDKHNDSGWCGESNCPSPFPLDHLVALIKGENNHTHTLDVFGAPCNCGTRHEYCGDCDWVEPCEPDFIKGENK